MSHCLALVVVRLGRRNCLPQMVHRHSHNPGLDLGVRRLETLRQRLGVIIKITVLTPFIDTAYKIKRLRGNKHFSIPLDMVLYWIT